MKFNYFYSLFILFSQLINCEKPNIIFILADDYGWGDVGLHGSSQVRTPNIDVLASNGIILNNYHVSPICTPSRGSLLTGRHAIHLGIQHSVFDTKRPQGLPLQHKTLPQHLKDLGYVSHAVGKWHLGFFQRPYIPSQRGFDTHFGYWSGREDYWNRIYRDGNLKGYDFRDNEKRVNLTEYEGLYSTHIYNNKSIEIIMNQKKNSSKPFFLYLAHQSVHVGNPGKELQVPQEYIDRFPHIRDLRRRKFIAMVSVLDDSVGEIFSALKKVDILDNTIIIFSTDNGGAIGNLNGGGLDNSMGSNWPLRGAKYSMFEGGVRGFAFIWSQHLKQRYVSSHLMHIQDWLPTIYSAAGGQYKDLGDIDGIDMWQTLNHNLNSSRTHLLHNIDDIWKVWGLRDGDYKLISGSPNEDPYNGWFLPPGETTHINTTEWEKDFHRESKVYKTLKQMNFTYKSVQPVLVNCSHNTGVKVECRPHLKPCLFDIRSDPCEQNNIYDSNPQIVKSMLKLLAEYNSTAVKPIVRAVDPKSYPANHDNWWDIYE